MKLYNFIIVLLLLVSLPTWAQQDSVKYKEISGPNSVVQQIRSDNTYDKKMQPWYALDSLDQIKNRFYDKTGFIINMDYNSQIMSATEVIGNNVGASGVFRIYGKYNFVGRGTPHEGGLIFKFSNRHRYTENSLREYGILDVGYEGVLQSVYNDQKWRMGNLYWRQTFGSNKVVTYVGFVDMTDWTDVHAAASPWSSFNNIVFATGSGTIGGFFPDGSFGAMVSAWLSDQIYIVGSLTDINGKATEFWKSFDTFFSKFETVKTFEIGFTPGLSSVFVQNAHITLWQVDAQSSVGLPSGWGVAGSVSWLIGGKHLPFLRGGWAQDGGTLYDASVSLGYTYNIAGPNTLGVGLNWNSPNENTFGVELRDQFSSEIFYLWKMTHHSEITPNLQLIVNPAFNTSTNFTAVFGLRGRFFI